MSEKKKIIITIARQYGSGGADTGKKLAEDLGISFYDKNILRMNSDESGIKESYFHLADEKAGNRLLYKIINTLTPEKGAPSFGSDLISADNLFRFQSEVIRKLAAEGGDREVYQRLFGSDPYKFYILLPEKTFADTREANLFTERLKNRIPAYTEAEVVVLKRNVVLEQHTYLGVNSVLSGYVCAEADAGSITGDIILGGNNDEQQ